MVFIINLLLKATWKYSLGTKLKYRFKKLDYQFKKVSWSIRIYKTSEDFQAKKWQNILTFYWFSKRNKYAYKNIFGFADPFLIFQNDKLFLFYEAIVNNKGEIWSAEIVNNKITNVQKIINETFHLSYPNVFNYKENFYMIPESNEDNTIRLYKCLEFPSKWEYSKTLYQGSRLVDTNFLELENTYYWFTFDLDLGLTRLFYSESFFSEWVEHKQSPMISNRNAGNFIFIENKILRPVQVSAKHYGEGLDLYEIIKLNKETYVEKKYIISFLSSNKGFNLDGTHHISVVKFKGKLIIAVDGKNNNFRKVV